MIPSRITNLFIVVLCLYMFRTVDTSHFRGGYISWKYVGSNTSSVTIVIEQVYWWTLSSNPCTGVIGSGLLTCYSSNCSNYVSTMAQVAGPCIASDVGLDISTSQSFSTVNLNPGSRLVLGYGSSAWIAFVIPGSSSYVLTTFIDLKGRTDNGQINSSPETNMAPIVTVRPGIRQSIRVPLSDIDGDIIKCRWANTSSLIDSKSIDECAGACLNIPGGVLSSSSDLNNNCTITFTANIVGYYVAALQIEDYMSSSPNGPPLSSIPLQFVIECINISCSEPNITGQISNGASVSILAQQTFVTTVYAKVGCNTTSVNRFLKIASPNNGSNTSAITSLGSGLYSIIFTWTPSLASQGKTELYCTMAVDTNNMQSQQYCISLIVDLPSTTTTTSTVSTTTLTTTSTDTTTSASPLIVYISTTIKEKGIDLPWILGFGIPLMILSGITGSLLACKFCGKGSKESTVRTIENASTIREDYTNSTRGTSPSREMNSNSLLVREYQQQQNVHSTTPREVYFKSLPQTGNSLIRGNSTLSTAKVMLSSSDLINSPSGSSILMQNYKTQNRLRM